MDRTGHHTIQSADSSDTPSHRRIFFWSCMKTHEITIVLAWHRIRVMSPISATGRMVHAPSWLSFSWTPTYFVYPFHGLICPDLNQKGWIIGYMCIWYVCLYPRRQIVGCWARRHQNILPSMVNTILRSLVHQINAEDIYVWYVYTYSMRNRTRNTAAGIWEWDKHTLHVLKIGDSASKGPADELGAVRHRAKVRGSIAESEYRGCDSPQMWHYK